MSGSFVSFFCSVAIVLSSIMMGHVALARFRHAGFGQNLSDEFVRDATGKAHQTDDAMRVRCENCATMRIDSGQSPAIPFWGRHISQSIHFRCLAFGGRSR